ECRLQLGRDVEVILDGALGPTGDDGDLLDAGGDRLLDDILDRGPVGERQHLLGDGLGRGQHTRAQSRRRDDRFAHFHPGLLVDGVALTGGRGGPPASRRGRTAGGGNRAWGGRAPRVLYVWNGALSSRTRTSAPAACARPWSAVRSVCRLL